MNNQRTRLEDDVPETIDTRNEEAERLYGDVSNSSEAEDLVGGHELL